MAEGRVAELLPPRELPREEACDVVPDREGKRSRVRLEGLDEHLPRRVAPAPPRELRDELERPLLGAEVRKREPRVRIHDGRHRDTGKVVALCHHLRPDEHRGTRAREPLERLAQRSGLHRRVGVEPDPFEPRHATCELGLEPLGSRADASQLDGSALRALLGKLLGVPTVVTAQAPVAVQGQRHVAAPAAA